MSKEENIGDVLKRRLVEHGLLKNFIASRVCEAAKSVSKGEFEPISFKNGALKIEVISGGKGQLVRLRQKEILSKINDRLGQREQVKRLIVVVKN
jgi:hypothetical protein